MSDTLESNKMGQMPIGKLLLNMGIPMMISMLVQALYNVVDGIFVSRINEAALTAVSMAFPMQNLVIAFSVGNGLGINAILSRALGSHDPERAKQAAKNGLFLQGLSYILFLVLGLLAVEPFMNAQSDDPLIVEYGIKYLRIVLCLSFGVFAEISFERFLQSTGRAKYSMVTQLCGAIFNIVFDPILIFGLLGFPKMGIAGAAAATVGGQIFGAAVGLVLNLKKNPEISLNFRSFRPQGEMLGAMCKISVPSIVMTSVLSLTIFIMDIILKGFSSTAVAVFGVYGKLQSFIFMPVFGLNNGIIPVLAYNYGAKDPKRIHETIKTGSVYASIIMLVGLLLMQLLPKQLMGMFDADSNMLAIGVPALRIISIHFLFAGVNIIRSSSCQAFGYSIYSLIISIARQLIILVPSAWLLSLSGRLELVWLCFPISEALSLFISTPMLKHVLKKTGMEYKKEKA